VVVPGIVTIAVIVPGAVVVRVFVAIPNKDEQYVVTWFTLIRLTINPTASHAILALVSPPGACARTTSLKTAESQTAKSSFMVGME